MRRIGWALGALLCWNVVALADGVETGIFVTGTGTVAAEPDMAMMTLGVVTRGETAAEAMQQNAAAVGDIIKELGAVGIADRDMQTTQFNMNPIWESPVENNNKLRKIVGFQASNSVTVRILEMSDLAGVIDAALRMGGNQFHGLSFGVKDDSAHLSEARKKAVAEAMAQAEQLAEASGLSLGPVLRITESRHSAPQPMAQAFNRGLAMESAVAGGELEIEVNVSMVFGIDH